MTLLEPTDRGWKILGEEGPPARHGGPVHRFWVAKVSEHFEADGFEVAGEVPQEQGRTLDLVARRSRRRRGRGGRGQRPPAGSQYREAPAITRIKEATGLRRQGSDGSSERVGGATVEPNRHRGGPRVVVPDEAEERPNPRRRACWSCGITRSGIPSPCGKLIAVPRSSRGVFRMGASFQSRCLRRDIRVLRHRGQETVFTGAGWPADRETRARR